MTLLLRLALPLLLSLLPPVAAWAQTTPPAPAAPAAPTAASAKPPSAGESQALQLFKLLDTKEEFDTIEGLLAGINARKSNLREKNT